ncbi:hypothetical protein BDQ17DRAFT_462913 [Cyathus striatus]|nr:hypothetical protein BDQ17DRAFT_462913 [Cyathus striatus]
MQIQPYDQYQLLEKSSLAHSHQCQDSQCQQNDSDIPHQHPKCHSTRRSRFLLHLLAITTLLFGVLAVTCFVHASSIDWSALFTWDGMGEGLVRRAADGTTDGAFTNRKLYLIIVFVGLFVVVILGIMLSAWCCRGSFENPLCCPCYLCACCGGLGKPCFLFFHLVLWFVRCSPLFEHVSFLCAFRGVAFLLVRGLVEGAFRSGWILTTSSAYTVSIGFCRDRVRVMRLFVLQGRVGG